ncbi:TetR/AcrR family transcriptional regulator [Kaistia dalseonensis]|uniref:AcrR family transcriptional regulator n=1 Tax=Kaistia dalseonensis TaxID=410840 RepID=A0ABU0H405_9HYPH|nr:TetR/AcrR family transcriptional regulator [Kaistia dalseonensis]MCX5493681.1 TetR/AcrR family transcriptional regulator [Kaistia dalseonensis]MDQ0436244.1 AcrR family transcriptional regulator [Kaistia dalseonensis]
MDVDRPDTQDKQSSPMRADARRNVDALLRAAATVFDRLGVEAPMRTIAAEAGVGVGTLYRHFPQRSDLVKAIMQREVDNCVVAAATLGGSEPPGAALAEWVQRLVDLASTKRGLGPALHSGDPAYQALPNYVLGQLTPALRGLLDAAAAVGEIRADVDARALLLAAMRLAAPASDGDVDEARRMVALLIDGLRFQASALAKAPPG